MSPAEVGGEETEQREPGNEEEARVTGLVSLMRLRNNLFDHYRGQNAGCESKQRQFHRFRLPPNAPVPDRDAHEQRQRECRGESDPLALRNASVLESSDSSEPLRDVRRRLAEREQQL